MGMFDKWTKQATNTAIETTKETLNDKLDTYSGIIKIGLTLGVIIFGSRRINAHISTPAPVQQQYPQPIVINNYYDRGYVPNGRKQGQYSKNH